MTATSQPRPQLLYLLPTQLSNNSIQGFLDPTRHCVSSSTYPAIRTSSLSAQAGSSPHRLALIRPIRSKHIATTNSKADFHRLACLAAYLRLPLLASIKLQVLSELRACLTPSQPRRKHTSAHEDQFHLATKHYGISPNQQSSSFWLQDYPPIRPNSRGGCYSPTHRFHDILFLIPCTCRIPAFRRLHASHSILLTQSSLAAPRL